MAQLTDRRPETDAPDRQNGDSRRSDDDARGGSLEDAASYGPLVATYGALAVASAITVRRTRGGALPRPRTRDVGLLGVATFKLSRMIAKDRVLAFARSPFVERTEPGEGSEVNSEPAGEGVRRAVGELVTCPFCVSVWIGTVLMAAFAIAPRATRLAAAGLSALAVADASQYAYEALRTRSKPSED